VYFTHTHAHTRALAHTLTVNYFVREGLAAGEVTVFVSLDTKIAFDAACWPSILID
jgi:hypothetical protein